MFSPKIQDDFVTIAFFRFPSSLLINLRSMALAFHDSIITEYYGMQFMLFWGEEKI